MNISTWLNNNFDPSTDWVLITGGSSGIAKEYMRAFAKLGCNIISICNSEELNKRVSSEIAAEYGNQIESIYCDLSNSDSVEQLLMDINKYAISVLVSNAGFGLKGRFIDGDVKQFKEIIGLHVVAPTLILKALLKPMQTRDKGLVINVATVNVASPVPNNAVYTATKTYIFNLALAVASENEHNSLIFQVLLPGTTNTPFHEKQGAIPRSMTMNPEKVVAHSLADIKRSICIPNSIDKILFPIFARIPLGSRMRLASLLLKRRLQM